MGGEPVSERTAAVAPGGLGKGPMYKSGSDVLHALLETSLGNGRSSARPKCSGTTAAGSGSGKV